MNLSLERLDAFHSECLGCPLAEVESGEIRVVVSERRLYREEGYGVIFPFWLLLTSERCVISVRPELAEPVRAIVQNVPDVQALFGKKYTAIIEMKCQAVLTTDEVQTLFHSHKFSGIRVKLVNETQTLFRSHSLNFYADEEHFHPFTVPDCRPLTPDDWELIDEMSQISAFGCPEECLQDRTAFGVIVNGKLVARSTTIPTPVATDKYGLVWVGVETLPNYRCRGYAKAVVSRTTETLLSRNLTPAYDCSFTNVASANTARALGYQLYTETLQWRYRKGEK